MKFEVLILTVTLLLTTGCANPGPDANVGLSVGWGTGPSSTTLSWGNPNAYNEAKAQLEEETRRSGYKPERPRLRYLRPGQRYLLTSFRRPHRSDGSTVRCRDGQTPRRYQDQERLAIWLLCPE